jgi:hypothetical protein
MPPVSTAVAIASPRAATCYPAHPALLAIESVRLCLGWLTPGRRSGAAELPMPPNPNGEAVPAPSLHRHREVVCRCDGTPARCRVPQAVSGWCCGELACRTACRSNLRRRFADTPWLRDDLGAGDCLGAVVAAVVERFDECCVGARGEVCDCEVVGCVCRC